MELAQLVDYLSNSSRILILDLKPVGRRKFGGLNVEKGKGPCFVGGAQRGGCMDLSKLINGFV